jgi:hypothetical protein
VASLLESIERIFLKARKRSIFNEIFRVHAKQEARSLHDHFILKLKLQTTATNIFLSPTDKKI